MISKLTIEKKNIGKYFFDYTWVRLIAMQLHCINKMYISLYQCVNKIYKYIIVNKKIYCT